MAARSLPDRWITDSEPGPSFPHYTRANAGEVLPDPVTPLAWTFMWESGLIKGCRDGFVSFGVLDYDEYDDPERPPSFGLFGGYFYNVLSQARLWAPACPGPRPRPSTTPTSTTAPRCPPTRRSRGTRASATPPSSARRWPG